MSYFQMKAQLAQQLLHSSWELSKGNHSINKPWSWADTWPVFKVDIPQINVSSVVLKDTSGESLSFGPGLMTTDVFPGDKGNSFIAAHRDTYFKQIGELKINDRIYISNRFGKTLTFSIDKIQIVDSRKEQPIIENEQSRVTLVTCFPFNSQEVNTPLRYLVSAKKIL